MTKASSLGSKSFQKDHGCKFSYMAGAMACAISGVDLVVALGKKGFLASYGCGGVDQDILEKAIIEIKEQLPNGPFSFNMLHVPGDHSREERVINLYLKYKITTIEASAYIHPTKAIIKYRVLGLFKDENGLVKSKNKIIAKLSRKEVAERFMSAPDMDIVQSLYENGDISLEQLEMSSQIKMADDITFEADSGGHTDGQSLIAAFPSMIALRRNLNAEEIRIGAAGGISTPHSVSAAFAMGADYVVTGSINQSTVEAGTSQTVKELLSNAEISDITMAPASDMFEQGGKVQVLKKGTIYPMRANFLYNLFSENKGIEDLSDKEIKKIEQQLFKRSIEEVRTEIETYLERNHPSKYIKIKKTQNVLWERYLNGIYATLLAGQLTVKRIDF